MTETKKVTIRLTGRRPVRVTSDEWPVIAKAEGDSYGSSDPQRHQQALHCGELDTYVIKVRQHEDGRAIVYAILDAATAWTGSKSAYAGHLCDPDADLAGWIKIVGEQAGIPAELIDEAIADLPAEEI